MSFTGNFVANISRLAQAIRNDVPVPFTSGRMPGAYGLSRGGNNKASQLAAMGSVGTLFSIVNRTSIDTASVEWHLHKQAQRAPRTTQQCELCDERGVSLVPQHPALSVWQKPNDFYTTMHYVETVQQHIDLTGEGWWVVYSVAGRPIEIWPVRPDKMTPVPHPTKFLSGWIYRGPDGEKVPLALDEVIQIKMPNPEDPFRGMGPVQAIMNDLDASKYSAAWINNFFINGAEPGGIVELSNEAPLDDIEFERMRQRWNEQHKGVANAHRVAILEMGTWKDRAFSQKDMQFAELRNVSREIIREAFGIHGHMLGLSEDVNRANADAAEVTHARHHTVSRLARWKEALNFKFLPMFGSGMGTGYAFAHANPVPEDQEAENAELTAKTNAYKTLVDAGANRDDAALVVGLPVMRERITAGVGTTTND